MSRTATFDYSGHPVPLWTGKNLAANLVRTLVTQHRFTGELLVDRVRVVAMADQGGSFTIQETNDPLGASNWTTTATVTVTASVIADSGWVTLTKTWWRAVYTNGATATGTLDVRAAVGAGSPVTALTGSSATIGAVTLTDGSGSPGQQKVFALNTLTDAEPQASAAQVAALQEGWSGSAWDRARFSNGAAHTAHTGGAIAAATTLNVWTPATNKRFRLLFATVTVNALAANSYVSLQDGAGNPIWITYAAGTFVVPLPPNGILSGAANNVLSMYTDGGATSWGCAAVGTEE